jgi:hypothetical protein
MRWPTSRRTVAGSVARLSLTISGSRGPGITVTGSGVFRRRRNSSSDPLDERLAGRQARDQRGERPAPAGARVLERDRGELRELGQRVDFRLAKGALRRFRPGEDAHDGRPHEQTPTPHLLPGIDGGLRRVIVVDRDARPSRERPPMPGPWAAEAACIRQSGAQVRWSSPGFWRS